MLFGTQDLPLHFLKVLDLASDEGLSQPQVLFMYIVFNDMFENLSKEEVRTVFAKTFKTGQGAKGKDNLMSDNEDEAIAEDKLADFKKGISEYVLT